MGRIRCRGANSCSDFGAPVLLGSFLANQHCQPATAVVLGASNRHDCLWLDVLFGFHEFLSVAWPGFFRRGSYLAGRSGRLGGGCCTRPFCTARTSTGIPMPDRNGLLFPISRNASRMAAVELVRFRFSGCRGFSLLFEAAARRLLSQQRLLFDERRRSVGLIPGPLCEIG